MIAFCNRGEILGSTLNTTGKVGIYSHRVVGKEPENGKLLKGSIRGKGDYCCITQQYSY